ncbi:unnamed protein product [Rotaria sp. Silwood2]|nr:unnamed protein product [Rotaria sp. Silwood2]CAF2614431.1 unnamed protein product [Rotaria sp. Silwood2]CAF2867538.1 unnamed protein product [Rotaria sp. Silwood2]CAF3007281.1 unnamed protein product [Rotaria sp. Silwood2]CAF4123782.1 unnamed protein product [Rotaria sp. Silwood2]
MTQKSFTIYATDSTETNKKNHIIKTYSFNTDDDDTTLVAKSLVVPNHKLVSVNSPSIDNGNIDDDSSEATSKPKTKRSRQTHDSEKKLENKCPPLKKYPWFMKIDWSKPLLIVGSLIFLYLIWTKQDIWIPRLLTSNARIQRTVIVQDREISDELTNVSSYPSLTNTSKDSRPKSTRKEDTIENSEEKNDDQDNSERTNIRNNEDSTGSSTKSSSSHRIHIRSRRVKMSFSKEHEKRKYHSSKNLLIDNDLDDINDAEQYIPITPNQSILLSRHSRKKRRHREIIPYESLKTIIPLKSRIRLSTYNDIIGQFRKNLKSQSRSRRRQFLSTLSNTTGLSKNKLHRFIYKKDFRLLNIQTFVSILDTFHLKLLIVPKQV